MPSHYKGSVEEQRALDAYIKLVRCTESLTARLQPNLERHGLTVSQFGVLEALLHLGPLCPSQLARKVLKSGGNMTLVISNLARDGYVRKAKDIDDKRSFTVHLTAKGERKVRQVFRDHLDLLVREMAALTPMEQQELARLCKQLGMKSLAAVATS
jgi:MarR family transcriptional regulator, 2-MHQ and catechol-resistance regulon repressor